MPNRKGDNDRGVRSFLAFCDQIHSMRSGSLAHICADTVVCDINLSKKENKKECTFAFRAASNF